MIGCVVLTDCGIVHIAVALHISIVGKGNGSSILRQTHIQTEKQTYSYMQIECKQGSTFINTFVIHDEIIIA